MKLMTTIPALILSAIISVACSSPASGPESIEANPGTVSASASQPRRTVVSPGIEVLARDGFAPLKGKRVGLITNPTGVDNSLRSTIDILAEAEGVTLAALFAPEHGVRGDYVAGAAVANETDPKTGVKVYSLHGRTRKPTPEMLRGLDVLVYDIQDIGCRSYTFISTMGLAMEAAAEAGIEFMVLDRPDPLGGTKVEGPLVQKGFESFVSQYPIPYLYGLTPGELARLLNGEGMLKGGVKAKLTVIPMEGWKRGMTFANTGIPWVLPSPHIPYPLTAELYPATGIMGELDYVSIGVGYTLPFGVAAAPWIDAPRLCDALMADSIPGVEFRPIHFKPFYAKFKGENLSGVQLYITDMQVDPLSLIQFYVMQELARLWPGHKPFAAATQSRLAMFDKVVGSSEVRRKFSQSYRVEDILPLWTSQAEAFRHTSAKYMLYK